ncbi:MAG: cysteine--tRNA ligase [Chloroflexota bacterium]
MPHDTPHPVQLYNSLTRRVEPLEPIEPGRVRIYTCGPTVYHYAHIGNLRSFLFADILRRSLEYLGYEVRHVKNVTDVGHMRDDTDEDRMELAAETEGKSPFEIAAYYTEAWLADEAAINILPVHVYPRATEHIGQMIEMTQTLLDRGLAYETNGNVYFDVSAFPGYGKLSGQRIDAMQAGHRVEIEADKHAQEDFALWKAAGRNRLMRWPSPWGEGFPGWHIECSAMSLAHLGEHVDIHTGGIDNKFPHHEDEIAQSEGALGHEVVRTWMHGEFLTLNDAKMAKSAGNIIRTTDLPSKGFDPLVFRYLALQAHYRSKLDFTEAAMQAAATGLARLRRAATAASQTDAAAVDLLAAPAAIYRTRFTDAISDDLSTPRAVAVAHEVASSAELDPAQKRALLVDFDRILGVDIARAPDEDGELPAGAAELLERRAAARAARDYEASDSLREELAALGVEVRDTPDGQTATHRG